MSDEKDKIMDIVIATKSLLDDFMNYMLSFESRLKKIEKQLS